MDSNQSNYVGNLSQAGEAGIEEQTKSKNNISQLPQNIAPSNQPNTKQQQPPKKQKLMEVNLGKASEDTEKSKGGNQTINTMSVSSSIRTDNLSQLSQNTTSPNQSITNHQQTQKNIKSKETKPEEGLVNTQTSKSEDQQIEILKSQLCIPRRRNPKFAGSSGRATEVEVNHFPLNLEKFVKKTVYVINIEFNPKSPKNLLRTVLKEFNHKHYPNVNFAFDGRRIMYTTKELKGKSDTITVFNEENNRAIEFYVTTYVADSINMNKIEEYLRNESSNTLPGDTFQALDIILKNRPLSFRFTNTARSFLTIPRITPVDLSGGIELWRGFFQSPVMGWKPYLNIDVSNKIITKHQPLTEYIKNELRCDLQLEMDVRSLNSLKMYVTGLKIIFMIPNQPNTKRIHKVIGVLDPPGKSYFNMEDNGEEITVQQFFKLERNYIIKYPHLPCLHIYNTTKKIALPIELCTVKNVPLALKKLSKNQTDTMLKNVTLSPAESNRTIQTFIEDVQYKQDPVLKDFGIQIKEQFASIPARVLNQPTLAYAQNKETQPKAGVWKPDKFSKAAPLNRWVVLNLDRRTNIQSIKNFEKMLIDSGREFNVPVGPMNLVITDFINEKMSHNEITQKITAHFEQHKTLVDLFVVIIPESSPGVYAVVKQASELKIGVLTQCIKSKTMNYKMHKVTSTNILLKINSKLNGINHTLAVRSSPSSMEGAIIFGADVNHPPTGEKNTPSVAAVVASHDLYGSQYNMEWRLQSPMTEIIQNLEDIVHKQLLKYQTKTNSIPTKIFYFRDGVNERNFLQLLEHELIAIRRACLRLNSNYKPSVTFMIVQRRHHTKMYPKHNIDMDGKFGNVISGTIIDTEITHRTELEFYLCSHSAIHGTARPTKYHLIWDENNFTEDQLEQLTFYLCFMFARSTRSTAYPVPTYYAHLAAYRARIYISNKSVNLNSLDIEQLKNTLNEAFTINNPMFFV